MVILAIIAIILEGKYENMAEKKFCVYAELKVIILLMLVISV